MLKDKLSRKVSLSSTAALNIGITKEPQQYELGNVTTTPEKASSLSVDGGGTTDAVPGPEPFFSWHGLAADEEKMAAGGLAVVAMLIVLALVRSCFKTRDGSQAGGKDSVPEHVRAAMQNIQERASFRDRGGSGGHDNSRRASPAATAMATTTRDENPVYQERLDPQSGRPYYIDQETGESTWARPATATTLGMSQQTSEWAEKRDPASGRPYYVHRVTRQTSWTRPAAAEEAHVQPGGDRARGGGTRDSGQDLANTWRVCRDPTSGRPYYVNAVTRGSSWSCPPGAVIIE